jgi:hypothetical protein
VVGQRTPERDVVASPAAGGPEGPTELSKRSWWAVLKRTVREFGKDNLSDWAAALTYYSVLSIFPAVIALTAVLGLLGPSATQTLIDNINTMVPGQGRDVLVTAIRELQHSQSLAGPLAIFGLAGALWSASGYIGAFMRSVGRGTRRRVGQGSTHRSRSASRAGAVPAAPRHARPERARHPACHARLISTAAGTGTGTKGSNHYV